MESALTDFKVRRLCIIYTTTAYYTHIYIFCQEVIVFIKGKTAAKSNKLQRYKQTLSMRYANTDQM